MTHSRLEPTPARQTRPPQRRRPRAIVAALIALSLSAVIAEAQIYLPDSDSVAYSAYAAIAGTKITAHRGSSVRGDLHSNNRVTIRLRATVDGDVTAGLRIRQQGVVTGTATEGAPLVDLPSPPSRKAAVAIADRTFTGDQVFVDEVFNDVIYVDGNVSIRGSINGVGSVIASGKIVVERLDFAGEVALDATTRLALIASGKIEVGRYRALRGALVTGTRLVLNQDCRFEGVLVASKRIVIASDSVVSFVDPVGDTVEPALSLVAPSSPLVTAVTRIDLAFFYADDGTGLDLASLRVLFNGADITDACLPEAVVASCPATLAGSGEQTVEATISDFAGNIANKTFHFEATLDEAAPTVVINSPASGAIVSTPLLLISASVADDGEVTIVTVNGRVIEPENGQISSQVNLREGANRIELTARDGTGKTAAAEVEVTLDTPSSHFLDPSKRLS